MITQLSQLIIEILVIVIFVKFRSRIKTKNKPTTKNLIKTFKPVSFYVNSKIKYSYFLYDKNITDMSDFDIFSLKNKNKLQLEKLIEYYGVGSCGPPGFYGSVDLHLKLQLFLSKIFNKQALIYSNELAAVQSIIPCFIKPSSIILLKSNSDAIMRGIYLTNATIVRIKRTEQWKENMIKYKRFKIFVIIDYLNMKTGRFNNLNILYDFKLKYNFFLICDIRYSFPLYKFNFTPCDIIIGSLSHMICSSGGFILSNKEYITFQQLASNSFCFSASMVPFMAGNAIINLQRIFKFNYQAIKYFHTQFKKNNKSEFKIISSKKSYIIILHKRNEKIEKYIEIRNRMREKHFIVGINRNKKPTLYINIKHNLKQHILNRLIDVLSKILVNFFLF